MAKSSYEFENEPASRPSFLTWLCILTFIGSGWALISSVYTFTSADIYANIISKDNVVKKDTSLSDSTRSIKSEKNAFSEKVKASFSKMLDKNNLQKMSAGQFIAALFTLAGALLMWNLKRKGFYLYIIGVIIGILLPFYLYGNDLIAVGASSFSNFFGLVFIALYAINLKSMTNN